MNLDLDSLTREVQRHALDHPDTALDRSTVSDIIRHHAPLLSEERVERIVLQIDARLTGLGVLEPLLADPDVNEIMVNGPNAVWVEAKGKLVRTTLELNHDDLARFIERIVTPLGLRVDRAAPVADARLPDGSRVSVVLRPLALDGPYVTIRRFAVKDVELEKFIDEPWAQRLRQFVEQRRNVLVVGGTGSGKTTLLNALARAIDHNHRVITIEDSAELSLHHPHVVRLESRPPNAEGAGEVTIRDLVRASLRMRPDRLVVGEVRGGEALDMVQAMNTGHSGSMSTCHANSCLDALRRLEVMMLLAGSGLVREAISDQLRSALDVVVLVERAPNGGRRIADIAEIDRHATPLGVHTLYNLAASTARSAAQPDGVGTGVAAGAGAGPGSGSHGGAQAGNARDSSQTGPASPPMGPTRVAATSGAPT